MTSISSQRRANRRSHHAMRSPPSPAFQAEPISALSSSFGNFKEKKTSSGHTKVRPSSRPNKLTSSFSPNSSATSVSDLDPVYAPSFPFDIRNVIEQLSESPDVLLSAKSSSASQAPSVIPSEPRADPIEKRQAPKEHHAMPPPPPVFVRHTSEEPAPQAPSRTGVPPPAPNTDPGTGGRRGRRNVLASSGVNLPNSLMNYDQTKRRRPKITKIEYAEDRMKQEQEKAQRKVKRNYGRHDQLYPQSYEGGISL